MTGHDLVPQSAALPANNEPVRAPDCVCMDPALDRLRDYIAAGMDQFAASRLIWCPPVRVPPAPAPALILLDPGRWGRRFVRHALATSLPWLRLPASEVSPS